MSLSSFRIWQWLETICLGLDRRRSRSELSDRESQSVLDVARLVEASTQKNLYALLRGWPRDRRHAGLPSGRDLDVGWQTRRVHQALRIGDRPLVERGDARRER